MKRFFLGVTVGVALTVAVLYSVQFYRLAKLRLQIALQNQGEVDFQRAFPDARLSVASIRVGGNEGDARLMARRDGEYVVNFEYLRGCVFKEFQVAYQVSHGKIQPQMDSFLQRLDASAKAVPSKGCVLGTVVGQ